MNLSDKEPLSSFLSSEENRLAALARYGILDTPYEQDFDDVVKLASQICDAPVSLISLVDADRQWFKAETGLGVRETSLDLSVCFHAIKQKTGSFEVPDAIKDERFSRNPLVAGDPHFRFYSSVVLTTSDGFALGTLCVLDYKPRALTEQQRFALTTLANQVMTQLELRRTIKEREAEKIASEYWQSVYETVLTNTPDFIYVIGLDKKFIYANDSLLKMWGRTVAEVNGKTFFEIGYETWHAEMHEREIEEVIATSKSVRNKIPFTGTAGRRIYDYIFSPVFDDQGNIRAIAGTTRDITDQDEIERALRLSEERRAVALEASDFVGIWDWDLVNNVVMADERFAKLYSVDPELAAQGAPVEEFVKQIHSDDMERVAGAIERVAKDGGLFNEEYRLLQADGSIRWVVAKGRPQLDKDGKPVRFPGVAIDITERKEAEQKLAKSEEDFVFAQEAGGIGVFSMDIASQILTVTPEFCRLYGVPQSEKIPSFVIEGLFYKDDKHIASKDETRKAGTAPLKVEYRIQRQDDGALRWITRQAKFIYDGQGKPIQMLGIVQDITNRKAAEDILKEREDQFRTLAQAMPNHVWTAQADGQLDWVNDRIYGYTGLDSAELLGNEWVHIVHPDDVDAVAKLWEQSIRTGESYEAHFRIKRYDNIYRWHIVRALLVHTKDGTARWIGTNTDIEDQRTAVEAAEAANIAKTEFLTNMSHEIRTPMNAVIGLSNILSISQPLSPKQKEYIQTLQMSAHSLLALINDLLDITKIETRNFELEDVSFNMAHVMQDVMNMMDVRVREKGLTFTCDNQSVLNKTFTGDPTRLRQILVNLCGNAIKFTEQGGVHVAILCEHIADADTQMVSIIVKDTGIGIPQEKLETIFHKFIQADSSINRKYGGTGLGLAITKTLTEIMGGELSVDSRVQEGSTFTVKIPLKMLDGKNVPETDIFADNAADKIMSDNKPQHVLLVEDYAPNVLVATTFLNSFGYECDVANNGTEAVEMVKNKHYDAALMDVQMHGMNGLEATMLIRKIEKEQNKKSLPIIGMTAHALVGDKERCLEAGMNDYIAKPFNPAELQEKLENLMKAA